jgi:FkbM family methyltransferase
VKRAFKRIVHYHTALGPLGALTFLWAKLTGTHPLFKRTVAGVKHPVYVRVGRTDASVLRQVLLEKHYELSLPVEPKVIIDAGGNIGLSAVYFANKYPDSIVIALEPEESNFQLLKKNVDLYPQIKPLNVALWCENKQIGLINPQDVHDGFQTVEKTENTRLVQAMTIDCLMAKMGVKFIDILKIDIEGAEKEVFENSSKWIDQVGMIMVELHDTFKPGCTAAFHRATKGFPKEFSKGEIVVRMKEQSIGNFSAPTLASL